MNTRAERHDVPGGFVESGTITHEGREYTSGGAVVTDTHLVCYPKHFTKEGATGLWDGLATSWHGEVLGHVKITGRAHGFNGATLTCYRVRLTDGRVYVGKGSGNGMILKARRSRAS